MSSVSALSPFPPSSISASASVSFTSSLLEFLRIVIDHLFSEQSDPIIISNGKQIRVRRSIIRKIAHVLPAKVQAHLPSKESFDILYPMRELYHQYQEEAESFANSFSLGDILKLTERTTTTLTSWTNSITSSFGTDAASTEAGDSTQSTPDQDPVAKDKILALERELALLREQIARIVITQPSAMAIPMNGSESTITELFEETTGSAAGVPPPPPPPPLPADFSFGAASTTKPKVAPVSSRSGAAAAVATPSAALKTGSASGNGHERSLVDVLKGLSDAKFKNNIPKSPGGTPLNLKQKTSGGHPPASAPTRFSSSAANSDAAGDFASVIAMALKRKFANSNAEAAQSQWDENSNWNGSDGFDSPAKKNASPASSRPGSARSARTVAVDSSSAVSPASTPKKQHLPATIRI